MPNGSVPLLIAIIVLILLSAFFSSTETAYSCASRVKLRAMASNGSNRAKKTLKLAEDNFDKLLSTILVGNNIVNITATTLTTLFFSKLITSSAETASLLSTIVTTLVVLIFGEITPKFIAKVYPEKFALVFYPVITFFYYLLYIFNFLFGGWKWLIAKVFRLKSEDVITEDEIMTVVEEAEEDGTLGEEETKMIRQVIEFDDLEVGDILVPRVNIVALDVEDSMEEIRKVFDKEGYSRLPVYKDSVDTIIGTVHQKDFYNAYLTGKKGIDGIMQNAVYTTEHVKISVLLKTLQKKKIHMAIVLDEYGGTLGLVTLEDILEELVGEIYDEHDEEICYFKEVSETVTLIDGNAPIDDTFKFFELDGEQDQFEANTLSGWIIEQLGEIPRVGVKLQFKNLEFEVIKSTIKKVLQVKVTILTPQLKDDE